MLECRTRPQANPIGLASVIRTLQSVRFAESTSTRILPAVMPYRGVTVTVLVVSGSPTKEFVMKYGMRFSRIVFAAFFIVAGVGIAQAEDSGTPALDSAIALNSAEQWASAVGQADIPRLNDLLHTDYLHVHATALVETKAKFIDALHSGARKYDPIKIEDANVRVFGDCAVISGRFVLRATTRERVIEGVNRFSLLVVNTPNGLRVATFHATPIPQPK